jgi:hypothetical protein
LEELDVGEMIILKYDIKEIQCEMWTEFIWNRAERGGRLL